MDSLTEEDSIGIETKEVYLPSSFCVKKAEPEVSLFWDDILGWYMWMFLFFLLVIYDMIISSENACNGFKMYEQDICTS